MTLDELKSLREGEVVVLTKVDERITEYNNYQVGDEIIFYKLYDHGQVDFLRTEKVMKNGQMPWVISHFSYEICDYIERKVKLERERKLKELNI